MIQINEMMLMIMKLERKERHTLGDRVPGLITLVKVRRKPHVAMATQQQLSASRRKIDDHAGPLESRNASTDTTNFEEN